MSRLRLLPVRMGYHCVSDWDIPEAIANRTRGVKVVPPVLSSKVSIGWGRTRHPASPSHESRWASATLEDCLNKRGICRPSVKT